MKYRINKDELLKVMKLWNQFLKRKVHLIACGGTAMTLLDVKPSTKDIDFMVPNPPEYTYLVNILKKLDYKDVTRYGWQRKGEIFRFDLFPGKRIHTTELLESPLKKENHRVLKEYARLYIGILNEYDLIASKLIRGTSIDFEDCLMLVKFGEKIDIEHLILHYRELVSYDISQDRVGVHIDQFVELLREEKLYDR